MVQGAKQSMNGKWLPPEMFPFSVSQLKALEQPWAQKQHWNRLQPFPLNWWRGTWEGIHLCHSKTLEVPGLKWKFMEGPSTPHRTFSSARAQWPSQKHPSLSPFTHSSSLELAVETLWATVPNSPFRAPHVCQPKSRTHSNSFKEDRVRGNLKLNLKLKANGVHTPNHEFISVVRAHWKTQNKIRSKICIAINRKIGSPMAYTIWCQGSITWAFGANFLNNLAPWAQKKSSGLSWWG